MLIIDVDHFKLFNDHYGHVDGDHCLKKISEFDVGYAHASDSAALRRPPRSADPSGARHSHRPYGGEEFAVLLQRADLETARRVAERLRRAVEQLEHCACGFAAGFLNVTISIGAAATVPVDGDNAQDIVERADAALYEAKRRGRNVVIAHCELMLAKAS